MNPMRKVASCSEATIAGGSATSSVRRRLDIEEPQLVKEAVVSAQIVERSVRSIVLNRYDKRGPVKFSEG